MPPSWRDRYSGDYAERVEPTAEEGVICPRCGAPMPIPPGKGVRILSCSFPDEPELVAALLADASRQVSCEQCGWSTAYESAAICLMLGQGKIFYFVPERVAREFPDLREQLMAEFEPAMAETGVAAELLSFDAAEEFQSAVGAEIRAIAASPLSEFSGARLDGAEVLGAWLDNDLDELDAQFFAAAWVLATGVAPIKVIVASKQSAPPGQAELLDDLRRQLRELVVYRLLRLAEVVASERRVREVESEVARAIHPVVADDEALRFLAQVTDTIERTEGAPAVQKYVNDAVLAAAALLGGAENPRKRDWAGWYVAGEMRARAQASAAGMDQDLLAPVDFARRTIDRQLLYAVAVRHLQGTRDGTGGLPPLPAMLAQASLIADFGIPEGWVAETFHVNVAEMTAEAVADLEATALTSIDAHEVDASLLVRVVLGAFLDADLEHFVALGGKAIARYCAISDAVSALQLACYVSSELNECSLCNAALDFLEEIRAAVERVADWAGLPAGSRAAFLTEQGNCLRYLGRGAEALAIYDECRQLVGTDLSVADVRVNERNRAIVLREVGQVVLSQSVLTSLIPHVSGEEKATVLLSLVHLSEAMDGTVADGLIDQALAVSAGTPVGQRTKWRLLLAGAETARRKGDPGKALERAAEALGLSDTAGLFGQAVTMAVAIRAAREADIAPEEFERLNDGAIEVMEGVVGFSGGLGPSMAENLALRSSLADSYRMAGRLDDAAELLLTTANRAEFARLGQAWKLWVQLAEYAALNGDGAAARERLEKAYRQVVTTVSAIGEQADQYSAMLDKDPLHRSTARAFLDGYVAGAVDAASLLVMADLQNSLALSERLRRISAARTAARAALSPFDAARIDGDAARQLLLHPSGLDQAAVLEFFQTGSEVRALLTVLSADGADTVLLPVSYPVRQLARLREELLYGIERWNPVRRGDPLAASAPWQRFAADLLGTVRAAVSEGAPIWIVPGSTLAGAPLHAALTPSYPCSYVPSFAIARVLRDRRGALTGSATWRPSSFFDFTVWQFQERAEAVAVFQQAADEFGALLRDRGFTLDIAVGTSATRARLLDGLAGSQCLRLSCHGFADPATLRFQLLISDGVQLPPSSPAAPQAESGRRFLVSWDELADLPDCAPLVFSSACGSGAAAGAPGGERVGLERPLLAAGALAYIAPQWSVPIAVIQPLINQVIAAYLTNNELTLGEALRQKTADAMAAGVPRWIASSLAIHGDWL